MQVQNLPVPGGIPALAQRPLSAGAGLPCMIFGLSGGSTRACDLCGQQGDALMTVLAPRLEMLETALIRATDGGNALA